MGEMAELQLPSGSLGSAFWQCFLERLQLHELCVVEGPLRR